MELKFDLRNYKHLGRNPRGDSLPRAGYEDRQRLAGFSLGDADLFAAQWVKKSLKKWPPT
ncbi:MAG: hypothetical protein Ct9H300mP23_10190 [Nitrospinota bacterium]|nr:MAG: hypothetical protein Ct9H300mP23_10190 [Nitrospinota bacterium]